MTKDLLIYESGNGGDIFFLGKDISFTERLYYKAYLSLFGGNVKASTKGNELVGEIREDWWGNSLFFPEEKSKQFNSETEKVLKKVALNSSGRIEILRAVENDLKYLKNISQIQIKVVILSSTEINIEINLKEPINSSNNLLRLVWDNAKSEIITALII